MPCPLPRVLQDHGGVIVNITATLGARGQMLQVHAGSAKAAVGTGAPSDRSPKLYMPALSVRASLGI